MVCVETAELGVVRAAGVVMFTLHRCLVPMPGTVRHRIAVLGMWTVQPVAVYSLAALGPGRYSGSE